MAQISWKISVPLHLFKCNIQDESLSKQCHLPISNNKQYKFSENCEEFPLPLCFNLTYDWMLMDEDWIYKTPLLKNSFSKISLPVTTHRWLLLLNYLHSCNTQEAQLTCSILLWDTVCMQYKQNYPNNLGIGLISFWVPGNIIFCRINTVNSRAWRNTLLRGKLHEPKQKEILFCLDVFLCTCIQK